MRLKITKAPDNVLCRLERHGKQGIKATIIVSSHDFEILDETAGARYWTIKVPVGFVTDFASVPRIFWSIINPIGSYSVAALLHDYLYSLQCELNIDRKLADDMFYRVMLYHNTNKALAYTMYLAVRLFGKSSWKRR